jgi:hypothetical protein
MKGFEYCIHFVSHGTEGVSQKFPVSDVGCDKNAAPLTECSGMFHTVLSGKKRKSILTGAARLDEFAEGEDSVLIGAKLYLFNFLRCLLLPKCSHEVFMDYFPTHSENRVQEPSRPVGEGNCYPTRHP